MDVEIWKDIPNYEGVYQASSLGRIKSLQRTRPNKPGLLANVKERILKPSINGGGYKQVGLYLGSRKYFTVHQLVAIAFLDHKRNGHTIVVDHINHDKTDNRLSNLQILTHRENSSKRIKTHSSKYPGVCWYKKNNTWHARIRINGRRKHLGYFASEIEASNAYQNALKKLNTK